MKVIIHFISRLLYLTLDLAVRSSAADSRTPTPQSQDPNTHSDQNSDRQVVPRSRWQTVLLEAGGIGAAVSEESMRRLKYCLQWLQVRTLEMSTWWTLLKYLCHSTPRPISTLKFLYSATLSTRFNLMSSTHPRQMRTSRQHTYAHCTRSAETS